MDFYLQLFYIQKEIEKSMAIMVYTRDEMDCEVLGRYGPENCHDGRTSHSWEIKI